MIRKIIILLLIILVAGGFFVWKFYFKTALPGTGDGIACTMEAKQCPDGSYVGRSGPKCEFAQCPVVQTIQNQIGTLSGRVTLGPTCPVERIPPDPQCAPKGFSTVIDIFKDKEIFLQAHTDTNGNFYIKLPSGDYIAEPHVDALYPRCPQTAVHVITNETNNISISCDTGIR